MFERMEALGVLSAEMGKKYKQHVDNLNRYNLEENEDDDIIMPGIEDEDDEA